MTLVPKSWGSVVMLKRVTLVSSVVGLLLVLALSSCIIGYRRYSEYEVEQRVLLELGRRNLVTDTLEEWQGPHVLERFELLRFMFSRIVMIEISQQDPADPVGDDETAQVSRLQHLRKVMITGANLTNSSCRMLSSLRGLRRLYIVTTFGLIDDRGIADIGKLEGLRAFGIDSDGVTDASIAKLSHCMLNELSLGSDRLTNKGIFQIPANMPLQELYLRGALISDRVVDHVSQFKELRVLWIQSPLVSNELIPPLTTLAHLHELGVSGSSIDDEVIPSLVSGFPSLRTVYMSDTQITASGHQRLCEERPLVHFAYY